MIFASSFQQNSQDSYLIAVQQWQLNPRHAGKNESLMKFVGGFSKNLYFQPYTCRRVPFFLTTTFQKGEIKIPKIQWNQCNGFQTFFFVFTLGKWSNLTCAYFFQKSWNHQLMMNVWFGFWGIPLSSRDWAFRGYPQNPETTGPLLRFRTTSDPARRMTIRQGLGGQGIGWNPGIL